MKYKVKEIFSSVQGEGEFIGVPMDFIRLAGCSVSCPIKKNCDTDYSSGEDLSIDDILNKITLKDVCITGGEPLEQDIYHLVHALRLKGHSIHIQTSGAIAMSKDLFSLTKHVVCSPKTPDIKLSRIDEIKVVYYGQSVESISKFYFDSKPHYLQPLNKNGKFNTAETIKAIKELRLLGQSWKLGIQAHKFWGLR